jgi:hypothetical protein
VNPTLCRLDDCRVRGRHKPTCGSCPVDCTCHTGPYAACSEPGGCGSAGCGRTDGECSGCLPRLAEEGIVCGWHVDRAARHLDEIVRLAPDARAVAYGEVRRSAGGGSNKPGSRSPGNDDAMDTIDACTNALSTICRDIAETRGLQVHGEALGDVSPADPLTRAARWLTVQLDWLRHAVDEQGNPVAADVFREIGDCASRLRSLVNGPGEQKYLGPCGAQFDIGTYAEPDRIMTCDGDVYGAPWAEKGRCKTCKAEVNQDERRSWLDAEVRAYSYTASEIAEAYGLKANTIRQWLSRGLLVQHGELQGRPLLLLGEVLDLAAGDAARREEARARRERRRTEGAPAA